MKLSNTVPLSFPAAAADHVVADDGDSCVDLDSSFLVVLESW